MNSWQQGYELDLLKALKKAFKEDYKPYVFGAFGMPNERDIATALSKGQVIKTVENDSLAIYQRYTAKSRVSDFTQDGFEIKPGYFFIKHIAGPQKEKLLNYLVSAIPGPILLEIFDENLELRAYAESLGFKYITTKIAASSDLKGIYAKNVEIPYSLPQEENINIKELNATFLSPQEMEEIRKELQEFSSWANHYSSYNKRQSWSAFAIRGYDVQDPNFIIKPGEMSQGWKKENPERAAAKSMWTEASEKFPKTKEIVEKRFQGATPDRVRFMRLTKGKGELSRHADITDREAGVQPGRVVRLHIPIYSNPDVIFQSWHHRGEKSVVNMKEGSLWFLDVRKPHTAVNNGDADRVHLVMDFYSTQGLTDLIKN